MTRRPWFPLVLGAAVALALAFLVLPVIAIFTNTAPGKLLSSLEQSGGNGRAPAEP